MDKAARKYFEGLMASFTTEALQLFALARPILARSDSPGEFNIPTSHHQHQADVLIELIRATPAIVADVHVLLALGEHVQARGRVKEALETLREVDPALFLPAPSPKLAAYLAVGPNADADVWASAISSATYANNDDRRRSALPRRRAILAAGDTLPSEEDVADLLTRDEAVAAMMKRGGGAVASRRA